MAPIFGYGSTFYSPITRIDSPFSSPRDRHSNDDKGPKSPRLRLTAVETAKLNTQLASVSFIQQSFVAHYSLYIAQRPNLRTQ